MNGPAPTGVRTNWSPAAATPAGDTMLPGAWASMNGKSAHGRVSVNSTVLSSTTVTLASDSFSSADHPPLVAR